MDLQAAHWSHWPYSSVEPSSQYSVRSFPLGSLLDRVPRGARDDLRAAYETFREATMPENLWQIYYTKRRHSLGALMSTGQRGRLLRIVAKDVCTTEVDQIVLRLEENTLKRSNFCISI